MNLTSQQNISAEIALLGAVFLNNNILPQIELTPDDFYKPFHSSLYKAMLDLSLKDDPIDYISIEKHLGEGMQYADVEAIIKNAVTDANYKYHSELIKEASSARKLQRMSLETISSLSDGDPLDDIVSNINRSLADILSRRSGQIVSAFDVSKDVMEYIERRREHNDAISGVPSGILSIDKITDGFQDGDLIIIAARPGMGKTALAMSMAQNAAYRGYVMGFISLEMTGQQLGMRSMSSLSGVDLLKIRKGYTGKDDFQKISNSASSFAELPIFYSFSAFDLVSIQKAITYMVQTHGAKMIILDYLQLARNANQRQREREIGEISMALKSMAKTYSIPIIALSQLNRDIEKRDNKTPKLADLRDSGQIEQDADVIMFLHREDIKEPKGIVEVHFAKGRNIGTGQVKLFFDGDKMQFYEARN